MKLIRISCATALAVAALLTVAVPSARAYVYNGQAWCCEGISYCVNPREFDTLCAPVGGRTFADVIQSAAATWNAQGTVFRLTYSGLTSDSGCVADLVGGCIGKQDGQNVISVQKDCSFPPGVLATSFWWYITSPGDPWECCITESDICFSNDYAWYLDADPLGCGGSCYDLESLALHEFGHWISLDHETDDGLLGYRPVMFPTYNYCEMRRAVTVDDAAGLAYVYDPGGVLDVTMRCDPAHNHPPYPGSPKAPMAGECPPQLCSAPCPAGPVFCDSVTYDPCLLVCPSDDVVWTVVARDSCGTPQCTSAIWIDFSNCAAVACPGDEPDWPLVYPDSCDPATGTYYFSVAASQTICDHCDASLVIDGIVCGVVTARFLDTDGDGCVTGDDIQPGPCNDYNCDFASGADDLAIHAAHVGHCCSGICPPGPVFCDSTEAGACIAICPFGDEVYTVVLKDSCGNPICDPLNTWIDFSGCLATPCAGEEPNWPLVYPDSCDPATGTHYFGVSASADTCLECTAQLFVGGQPCRPVTPRFYDLDGDRCVTQTDQDAFENGDCTTYADFNCNGVFGDIADLVKFTLHKGHCCSGYCPPGGPFCDSVTTDPCLVICPQNDLTFHVVVKDSCGNPVCDPGGTWLDFGGCPAVACPNEPDWPRVAPDSCDPATGTHYFSMSAGLVVCTDCFADLYVDSLFCRQIPARYLDTDGDLCVTPLDMQNGPCNDYNCDFALGPQDVAIHNAHIDHCCPPACDCILQGDFDANGFIDAVDLGALIDAIFFGGPDPQDLNCPATRGDLNCDGFTDAVDLAIMIDHIFFGGAPPCDPCLCTPYPTVCP